jgi:hypothetical protein
VKDVTIFIKIINVTVIEASLNAQIVIMNTDYQIKYVQNVTTSYVTYNRKYEICYNYTFDSLIL